MSEPTRAQIRELLQSGGMVWLEGGYLGNRGIGYVVNASGEALEAESRYGRTLRPATRSLYKYGPVPTSRAGDMDAVISTCHYMLDTGGTVELLPKTGDIKQAVDWLLAGHKVTRKAWKGAHIEQGWMHHIKFVGKCEGEWTPSIDDLRAHDYELWEGDE